MPQTETFFNNYVPFHFQLRLHIQIKITDSNGKMKPSPEVRGRTPNGSYPFGRVPTGRRDAWNKGVVQRKQLVVITLP